MPLMLATKCMPGTHACPGLTWSFWLQDTTMAWGDVLCLFATELVSASTGADVCHARCLASMA